MEPKIVAAKEKVRRAEAELRSIIRETVLACAHPQIADDDGSPPMRICLNCGLTDEGWGCGFQRLTNDPKFVGRISHDELLKLRTVSIWQRNYGTPLTEQIDRFPF